MTKKGVYFSNQGQTLTYDKVERKIFNHLLRTPKGATQTQLSTILKIPRGQIIDRLSKLLSKPYLYNQKTYRIIRTKFIYKVIREKPSTQGLETTATPQQKKEFDERFENCVENLSSHEILKGDKAEIIDDTTIFANVHPKKAFDFKATILELYNDEIYDIAIGEKGICIILKEDPNNIEKTDIIKNNILKLYDESIKRKKPIRKRKPTKKVKN